MIRLITKTLPKQALNPSTKLPFQSIPFNLQSNSSILHNEPINNRYTQMIEKVHLTYSFSRHFASKAKKVATPEPENTEKSKAAAKSPDVRLKFHKVTDERSQQNSQSFFMKCMELLPESAIPELTQKIEVFKSKWLSGAAMHPSAADEHHFLSSCQKFFEKHQAEELMDYLVKMRPQDLRPNMLSGTVFGFDSQIDIKTKLDKFHTFSSNTSPESMYSSDETERLEVDNAFDHKEQTDADLLSKISKMSFTQPTKKGFTSELFPEDNPAEGIEGINDFSGLEGLQDAGEFGASNPIMNDLEEDGQGGESLMDYIPTRNLMTQSELDVSQAIDRASSDMLNQHKVGKRQNYIKRQLAGGLENIMLYKTQGKEEVVFLTQRGFEERKIKPTNYVYFYGLPYEIKDEAEMKKEITKSFSTDIGDIKSIKLFSFKNYLDITESQRKIKVHSNLEAVFDPMNAFSDKLGAQSMEYAEDEELEEQTIQEEAKANPIKEKKVKDSVRAKMDVTKKILSRIKAKANLRLDKSYALIELADEATKKRALSPDLRIFGMHIDGRMCMIDDADHKLTINVYNVHWGSTLKNFCTFVNKVFQDNNLLDLQLEIPANFEHKILTKFYVLLRFSSFANTIRAMEALEGATFEKRSLKVQHLYGSLKLYRNEYSEVIDMESSSTKTERVTETKVKEAHRISFISKEDDLFNEFADPLVKIEKDIQTYVAEEEPLEEETYRIRRIGDRREEKWYQSSDSVDEDEKHGTSEKYQGGLYTKSWK